jgi:hypothetical protein
MVGFRPGRRALVVVLVAALAGVGCAGLTDEVNGTGTMVLGFGTYDVTVTIPAGEVTGGPIVLTEDVTFGASFLTSEGEPDERVMEPRFRLDVAAVDTTYVRILPGTAFSATLQAARPEGRRQGRYGCDAAP